jgi:hypothetical protein
VMRAQRWKTVEPLVKSYFGNTIHLLGRSPHAGRSCVMLNNVVHVFRAYNDWTAQFVLPKPFELPCAFSLCYLHCHHGA